jgi:cation transport ATPase
LSSAALFPFLRIRNIGNDIVVKAADIALVLDDTRELPHLLSLSAVVMKKIKLNTIFSMMLNVAAAILAMLGILSLIYAALVHNMGSVFVSLKRYAVTQMETKEHREPSHSPCYYKL